MGVPDWGEGLAVGEGLPLGVPPASTGISRANKLGAAIRLVSSSRLVDKRMDGITETGDRDTIMAKLLCEKTEWDQCQ